MIFNDYSSLRHVYAAQVFTYLNQYIGPRQMQ